MSNADGFYRNAELQYFCDRMIASVNIACATRDDVDKREEIERKIGKVRTNDRHTRVNAENLARMWNIGLDSAKRTLQVTPRTGTRSVTGPLHRMLRVDHLDLHGPRLKGVWFVDTLIAGINSITQKTVWWDRGDKNSSTADPKRLARWLGISHRIGSDMCYWLITDSGQIISKSSV